MRLFLKNLLFTLVVPGTVAIYLPLLIARGRIASSNTGLLVIGPFLIVLGAGIYVWCVWDFASIGRGTPLPVDAPRRLIVRGLYRYSRNPMYLGVLLVVLGWSAVFASPQLLIYAMGVGLAVHLFVVFYEEHALLRSFGRDYEAYRKSVPRWIPRLRRHPSPDA